MNFQNLPARTEAGLVVKRSFLPTRGAFSYFDYQQIEPRLFAYFAARGLGDTTVADWYYEGRDVYQEIAAKVYGRPADTITKEERDLGKVWFLMSLYGAGPRKVSAEIGMSYGEAKDFYLAFHDGLPQIKGLSNPPPQSGYYRTDYVPGLIERTLKRRRGPGAPRGYLTTPWGRHLHPEEWGEHKMLNKLIQGSAADLMKLALIRVHRALKDENLQLESKLILTVHDEIDIDGPEDEIPVLHSLVPFHMTHFDEITDFVPLGVDHEVSTEHMAAKVAYEEWFATQEVAA